MFSGIKPFSELADYFMKYGEYPYEDEYNEIYAELNRNNKKTPILPTFEDYSPEMQEFALYWIDKFVNGDGIGDNLITGEHSFYLNVAQIVKVFTDEFGRKTRDKGFPDFWDEDYKYFWCCDIGRWGITEKKWQIVRSKVDFNIIETPENLGGGKDVVWGKPRGVGASWKGGNYANYNQFLIPNSNTFILADKADYLEGDGIFSKFITLRSFIMKHCWWIKKSFVKESASDFEFETGYKTNVGGGRVNEGFSSKVLGITVDGDKEKARGGRGNYIFEEFGSFPIVDAAWKVTDASVEQYGAIFGQRRGFGTGGDSHGGLDALQKMMYDPKPYRLLEFKNIYEEIGKGNIAYFSPAYINTTHKDENGNSDHDAGKAWLAGKEKELKEADDITLLTAFYAEYCTKPSDMFKVAGVNILPIALAEEQLTFLERTNLDRKLCTYGKISPGLNKVIFTPENKLPYEEFPAVGGDRSGCVALFKKPCIINGKVPSGVYIISVDAYTQDKDGGKSIGSVQVIEQFNKYTPYKGDCIVAWFDSRPEGFDGLGDFAAVVFLLAEMFNAKVCLENDQVGDVVSYAKKNRDTKGRKLTLYLEDQLDLGFNQRIATKKTMNRDFGMNMTNPRFMQGLKYFQQWLIRPRGYTKDGKLLLNIHFIYSRGLLREIKGYNGQNADRLSAMIIAIYNMKENEDNLVKNNTSNQKIFQTLKLFN